eukprot:TRINITY_DN50263_c0_g1_i1.p1 TRINITY_DN50263_c0_g1~~TRINITY_DN50263_c0_g1_i1.p1  ORF type:complete len:286 (+),score=64.25 TRINITY_DN50263_c0_g1_i1:188-1045(+)
MAPVFRPPPRERSHWEVLGLQPGADQSEVRRAYLQKARETHPDKGGSPEEFRRVVVALEQLTGANAGGTSPLSASPGSPPAAGEAERSPAPATPRRFSTEDVSDLARQLRRLQQEALAEKLAERESRRLSAQQAASAGRQKEEAMRLNRALRVQRRATLPSGVKFCVDKAAPMRSPTPGRIGGGGGAGRDFFRAAMELEGEEYEGPQRRSIDDAEKDLRRMQSATSNRSRRPYGRSATWSGPGSGQGMDGEPAHGDDQVPHDARREALKRVLRALTKEAELGAWK